MRLAYGFRWVIHGEGQDYFFERDEEGAYRMYLSPKNQDKIPQREWIEAVIQTLESLSK